MIELKLINPFNKGCMGRVALCHFAFRFPSTIIPNNMRVDQKYTKKPDEFLVRKNLSETQLRNISEVILDIDEYLLEHRITLEEIDSSIEQFIPRDKHEILSEPERYISFLHLSKPVFIYLVKEKKHGTEYILT